MQALTAQAVQAPSLAWRQAKRLSSSRVRMNYFGFDGAVRACLCGLELHGVHQHCTRTAVCSILMR